MLRVIVGIVIGLLLAGPTNRFFENKDREEAQKEITTLLLKKAERERWSGEKIEEHLTALREATRGY